VIVQDEFCRQQRQARTGIQSPSMFLRRVTHGAPAAAHYTVQFGESGRYVFGPLHIMTRFPFGLLRHEIVIPHADELIVLPRVGRFQVRHTSVASGIYGGRQRSRSQRSLMAGDFHSLRDWRPGDSRRWIHWRTSARQGALMVRQFERQQEPDIAVFVDLWWPEDFRRDQAGRVELALSVAASHLAEECHHGLHGAVLAVSSDADEPLRGTASRGFLYAALKRLALSEPDKEDRLPAMLRSLAPTLADSTRLVIVGLNRRDPVNDPKFGDLWQDPRLRCALSAAQWVSSDDEQCASRLSFSAVPQWNSEHNPQQAAT
jgi:uncharacterized protein (DUF58 family)